MSWSPRRALSSRGYRPAFGDVSKEVLRATLVWQAIIYTVLALSFLVVGFIFGALTLGIVGWVHGTLWNAIIQAVRILVYVLVAMSIAGAWALLQREHRALREYLSLSAMVFSFSVSAEVLAQPLSFLYWVYESFIPQEYKPVLLSLPWIDYPREFVVFYFRWALSATQFIVLYARYVVFAVFALRALQVVSDRKRVVPIIIASSSFFLAAFAYKALYIRTALFLQVLGI